MLRARCSLLGLPYSVRGMGFSWSSMDVHGEEEGRGGLGNGKRASVLTGREAEAGQPCSHAPPPSSIPQSSPHPSSSAHHQHVRSLSAADHSTSSTVSDSFRLPPSAFRFHALVRRLKRRSSPMRSFPPSVSTGRRFLHASGILFQLHMQCREARICFPCRLLPAEFTLGTECSTQIPSRI